MPATALARLEAAARDRGLRLRWETWRSHCGLVTRQVEVFAKGQRVGFAMCASGRGFDEARASESCAEQLLAPG